MIKWEHQDKGWYTSELGGIAEEARSKWYFYPIDESPRRGPYRTFAEARAATTAIVPAETPAE